jgi:AraC family transcriptional regulator
MQRPATAVYPPGAHLLERVIDDYELVWLLHGQATLVCSSPMVLSPGQLLLIPPGLPHAIDWDPRRTARHGYVHFEQSDVTTPLPGDVLMVPMSGADPLASLCAYLVHLGSTGPTALATLDYLLTLMLTAPAPPPVPAPIAAAVEHLRRSWSRLPISRVGVAELAAAAHVSRGYLNRLFRATFDVNVAEALECLRFARAEPLLTRTDLSVAAVATQCGFADPSHFSHRFTARYGIPPSRYTGQMSVIEHPGVSTLYRLVH